MQKRFYHSVAKDKRPEEDAITYVDCNGGAVETDVNIIKCEETELKSEAIDLQIITHNSSEYDQVDISNESNCLC